MIPIILAVIAVIVGAAANIVGIRTMQSMSTYKRHTVMAVLLYVNMASCLSLIILIALLTR